MITFLTLEAFFDIFKVSETFPVLWFPGGGELLKIYDPGNAGTYNLGWTRQKAYENVVYIRYRYGTIEITNENDEFRFLLSVDNAKNLPEIIQDLNKFPFPIQDIVNQKSFCTYHIDVVNKNAINIDVFNTAMMIDGYFSNISMFWSRGYQREMFRFT